MTTSFWLTAPREGFSARCIAQFGCSFDSADRFSIRSTDIPTRKRSTAVYASAYDALSGHASNQASAMLSSKAMQRSGKLIGGSW